VAYIAPSSWPPPPGSISPWDDWEIPEGWTHERAARRQVHVPPDGRGFLIRSQADDGGSTQQSLSPTEDRAHVAGRMVERWARAVQRDAHTYYIVAMKAAWIDRAIDYAEDWSPSEASLSDAIEDVWVLGYHVVLAAYQMERWLKVWLQSRGQSVPRDDAALRTLRNALEHLDDAAFRGHSAVRNPEIGRRNQSIDQLPGRELFLGAVPGAAVDSVFGLLDLGELVMKARKYAYLDDAEASDLE
jgi:hypothetical protein